ncbi:TetR/AcrR family transcriptional regulator [Companilactobacillus ginsenosidimutans]|uniref:Transcriptional regulator n=1 Tax=Companilactobacillus ginsenosidimutans TaxID=1007676 RepID=A0A0H4QKA8_9LACO|nr:TetR/AcrR family transcriptional regulator [Companilactobacillus ginsenosidimutans]AKP67491.1 transcriptional regulator [Companilactobacillus ginsenosidimutans]
MVVDKRVLRTDKALKDAFRALSKTNSYHEITVKKLTEKAGINRKTFYLHYDSIDDFLDTFVNELSDELLKIITEQKYTDNVFDPGETFDALFDFFDQSRDFYTFILTSDEYSFMSRKVENKVTKGFTDAIEKAFHITHPDALISANFVVRNTLMLFRLYDRGDILFKKAEFKDCLMRLDRSGLKTFI